MAYYAFLNNNNIVTEVIVGNDENKDNIDWEQKYSEIKGQPCKRTSYSMSGGIHTRGGTAFRKNFAGVGFTYDPERDAFIPPKPFDSWSLNENTCCWDPPVPHPTGLDSYVWDEDALTWKALTTYGNENSL